MTTTAVRLCCGLGLATAFAFTLGTKSIAAESTLASTETRAGWVKHPGNPVLGGALGTCFDISVLPVGDTYRM